MTRKAISRQAAIVGSALFVITMCLQASCTSKAEGETPAAKPSPGQLAEAKAAAAKLFSERSDVAKLREAVRTLSDIRDPENRDFETEWLYSKYSFFLGKAVPEKEKEAVWERGKAAGQIAARLEPNRPEGHFWYGANLGELAKLSPVTVGIKSVDDIRSAMNRVIEIDPAYQSASALKPWPRSSLRHGCLVMARPKKRSNISKRASSSARKCLSPRYARRGLRLAPPHGRCPQADRHSSKNAAKSRLRRRTRGSG